MHTDNNITDKVDFLHRKVKGLLKQDASEPEIIDALQKEGVDEFYARTIIENVLEDERNHRDFWKLLLMGIFIVAAGIGINYFSYQAAVNTGAMFFYLFWGVIVTGVVMIVKAFILLRK